MKNNIQKFKKNIFFTVVVILVTTGTMFHLSGNENQSNRKRNKPYSWESPMAKATATGDLLWAPQSFVFEKGSSVRYIDFEKGDDNNSGQSKSDPWKHHPWDPAATANSDQSTGTDTYVFKRGSVYRGTIVVQESGKPGNPIRFTSDPSWGYGEATFYGSVKITGGWKKEPIMKIFPMSPECGIVIWIFPPELCGWWKEKKLPAYRSHGCRTGKYRTRRM